MNVNETGSPRGPENQMDEDAIAFAQGIFDLASNGGTQLLDPLLEAGVPVDIRTSEGDSLLMLATFNGQIDTARLLLERGADPDLANDRLQTPLAAAIRKGDLNTTNLLLAYGAGVDASPENTKSPMMYAAMVNRPDLIDRLLEAGADPGLTDADGNTALSLARATGSAEAVAKLEGLGRDS